MGADRPDRPECSGDDQLQCSLSSLKLQHLPSTNLLTNVTKVLRMANSANAGLAYPLDKPLAQNLLSPRKDTASSEPITRPKAITILLHLPEDNIFPYLRFARCHNSLSHDQYLAICALKGCSDAEIRNWLKEARKPCGTRAYLLNYKS